VINVRTHSGLNPGECIFLALSETLSGLLRKACPEVVSQLIEKITGVFGVLCHNSLLRDRPLVDLKRGRASIRLPDSYFEDFDAIVVNPPADFVKEIPRQVLRGRIELEIERRQVVDVLMIEIVDNLSGRRFQIFEIDE
jgi:hypothetical protein